MFVKYAVGRVDDPLTVVGMNHLEVGLIARRVRLGGQSVDAIELRRPMGMRLAHVPLPGSEVRDTVRVHHQGLAATKALLVPLHLRHLRGHAQPRENPSLVPHRRDRARVPAADAGGTDVTPLDAPDVVTPEDRQDGPREPVRLLDRASLGPAIACARVRVQDPPLRVEDQHGIGAVPERSPNEREVCLRGHAKPRSATLLHSRSRSERIGHARHLERSPFCSQVNVALKALCAPALGKRLSHPIPGVHCPARHTSPALQQPHPHWTVSGSQVIVRH